MMLTGTNSNADIVVSKIETHQIPDGFAVIYVTLTVVKEIALPIVPVGTMKLDDLATFLSLHGERSHLEKACILAEQTNPQPKEHKP
jgi:hypothetical protein